MAGSASGYPKNQPTILAAIKAMLPPDNVVYVPGSEYDKELDIPRALAAAKDADAAVVCLGEMAYAETPGNIDDLELPDAQINLAQQITAMGKPVVLLLVEGRPRIINRIVASAKAIVLALNPGNAGGQAVADVLLGEVNPSGRLPITYPRYPNALLTYDHKQYEDEGAGFGLTPFQPQFPFGLSYTRFEYSKLQVSPTNVSNGASAGAWPACLRRGNGSSVSPKFSWLRGNRQRSRSLWQQMTFHLSAQTAKSVLEPGMFDVFFGSLKSTFELK